MTPRPRIVVFGAGSIGCHVGLTWLAAGLDIRFVGRASLAERIAGEGLSVEGDGGTHLFKPQDIAFSTSPEALADADIIVLSVKTTDDEPAAAEIAAHARPGTLILSLQNGVENAVRLSALLPTMSIVEGMVPYNVVRPTPTRFRKTSAGHVAMGRNASLEAAFAPLSASGQPIDFVTDMTAVKWSKLLLNLNNPLNALSGLTLHEQLSQRAWRRLLATLQGECLEVMSAEEIEPAKLGPLPPWLIPYFLATPDWLFNRTGLKLQKIARDARSSMADDFAAGRRTEIDFLNGTVAEHGRRHGVPCPANETMVELVKQAECGGRKNWTPREIAGLINQRMAGAAS
ncbi:2-dehydropantoate 2-reductase [Rhizobium sp. C1]|uniref:2-dehydropantoate 2-reductase n=1 Tax=Rhizobium sp. C1 TaxID=1349799 RepID=UPI001E53C1D8|nr:2-dehydropantoate 2-reductase [Rhizobium sp. C1]MCD2176337.1 2-dehydropantoate 2-reductase [Rhizobium sp. C1]